MRTFVIVLTITLVGCASLANTPAQDRTWARLETCQRSNPGMNLGAVQVRADGSWSTTGDLASVRALTGCMGGRL